MHSPATLQVDSRSFDGVHAWKDGGMQDHELLKPVATTTRIVLAS